MNNITVKRPPVIIKKKKHHPLAILAIIVLCFLISISIGFFIAFNNTSDEVILALEATGGTIQLWIVGLFNTIKSDEFLNKIPAIQSIVVTIAGMLSILVAIKQLKRKD